MKNVIKFFDELEDRIRHRLSRYPVLYAMIGGIGVVLFWRGIWDLSGLYIGHWTALILSLVIMLLTGTFVSFFIGEQIILSGLKQEKRLDEKTETEIQKEEIELYHIDKDLESIKRQLAAIKKTIDAADL
ncbi:MAG: hypothetical protein AAB420_01880 [Patescibacteria group bacterium]